MLVVAFALSCVQAAGQCGRTDDDVCLLQLRSKGKDAFVEAGVEDDTVSLLSSESDSESEESR
jgi:hypothetical protein